MLRDMRKREDELLGFSLSLSGITVWHTASMVKNSLMKEAVG